MLIEVKTTKLDKSSSIQVGNLSCFSWKLCGKNLWYCFWAIHKSISNTQTSRSAGKSLSEAHILGSTNPQYDKQLFIDLPVQYMKTTSSEHIVYINLLSYCGLVDARICASEKDLPVSKSVQVQNTHAKKGYRIFLCGYFIYKLFRLSYRIALFLSFLSN